VRVPFLFQAGAALALLVEKVSARTIPTLRGRPPQHWRAKGFLRLAQSAPCDPRLERDDRLPQEKGQSATRVFLVGCERSGTTLLQSLLAAHSGIYSVPETHFVKRLFRNDNRPQARRAWPRRAIRNLHALRRKLVAKAGWVSGRSARAAWREVGEGFWKPSSFWDRHSARAHMQGFVDAMDTDSLRAGKRIWIEKTPEHLFCIPLIRQHVAGARFIHIVRDGSEVVASLNHLAKSYPQWRPFTDVSLAVERWNHAWRATKNWIGHPDHLVVRYETLLQAPRSTLARVLHFLDCDPEHDVLRMYPGVASRLIRADEPWKAGNMQNLRDCRKFAKSFDPATQSGILGALDEADWDALSWAPRVIADYDRFYD
jgi:hypothetical protein